MRQVRNSLRLAVLAIAVCAPFAIVAQEVRYPVIYISGHGAVKKFRGEIVFGATELRVEKAEVRWGRIPRVPMFDIPYSTIVSVRDDIAVRAFLIIVTESAGAAEAIMLQVAKQDAAGIAAKITFAVKKAREPGD